MPKRSLIIALLAVVTLLSSACGSLGSKPIFSDEAGALRGYDPVAYFTEKRAVPGRPDISYTYGGASFHFASDAHRRQFVDRPEQYLPQYGGYCAYGMSRNFVVSSDPEAFSLVDGKLYLNYSMKVRTTWQKDIPGNIAKADANWASKIASGKKIEQ